MFRYCQLILCISAMLLTVSCRTVTSESSDSVEAEVEDAKASEDSAEASDAVIGTGTNPQNEQLPTKAEPSRRGLPPGYTIAELKETIRKLEAGRAQAERFRMQRYASEQRALNEVRERGFIPEKYGQTIRITPDNDPLYLPPGPMEELVNMDVSMRLQDANVNEMIMALSEIDGLNIVADQSLQGTGNISVTVRDVPLRQLLSYISRNMGIEFHIAPNIIWVTQSQNPDGGGVALKTRVFQLRKGFIPQQQSGGNGGDDGFGGVAALGDDTEDTELYDALEELLADSPQGAVLRVFKNRNLLLVRNTHENLRIVEEMIRSFDIIPRQVLIEARFLTISQSDLNALGVELDVVGDSDISSSIDSITGNTTFSALSESMSPTLNMAISGILDDHEYSLVLNALHKLTDAETLSAPRLTVMNNQTARIRRGTNFFYWDEWELVSDTILTSDGAAADDPRSSSVQPVGAPKEVEEGITLEVHVNVGNDAETVLLSLIPSIKQVESFNTFDATGNVTRNARAAEEAKKKDEPTREPVGYVLPEISESSVNTKLAIQSGETVVLGGILENRIQEETQKVPILGDLPFVGVLFRRTLVSHEPRHLLIFVTARIVSPSGQYVEVNNPEDTPSQ